MPLTPEQVVKVNQWLASKAPNYKCPACNSVQFSAGALIAVPNYESGKLSGGTTVPMVQVICNECAHVTFFASVRMGIQ